MITGGLSGIGAATAVEFGKLGARLLLCDNSTTEGDGLVAAIQDAGGEAIVCKLDVRDPDALQVAAERAEADFGRIDVLVACAGISDQSAIATGDPERWRALVDINLIGTIFAARAVTPAMNRQESGHIFIVASVSGRESYVGESVYIASKWGQVGFAHSLRLELMSSGIRVSLIEPGLVDTPLTRDNPTIRSLLEEVDPLLPADVAAAIAYAYQQPPHVVISELVVRPLRQRIEGTNLLNP